MKLDFTWKIWLLIIVLIFSLVSIFGVPPKLFQKGVLITSVSANSTAFEEGIRQGQIITEIDGVKINNIEDYSKTIQNKFPLEEIAKTEIKTDKSDIIFFSKNAPQIIVSDLKKT
ncbi:MAG: PDZ domain-containing protein, partial [archaeon]